MKRTRQILTATFVLLILLIGIPLLMTYRAAVRQERNRALIRAIRQQNFLAVQSLLHQGADPNARELPEPTGTLRERLLALLDLLRHGPPKPPPDARSALMLAVEEYNAPITVALLNAGAKDVNARILSIDDDPRWPAPLIVAAAREGNLEIVKALLDKGADAGAKDDHNETALVAATARNTLFGTDHCELPKRERQTEEQKQTAIVRVLLERGGGVRASDTQGWLALRNAARQDNVEMVKVLLDRGANVRQTDKDGMTVLHYIASGDYSYPEILQVLVSYGADVNARDNHGETPLSIVAHEGNEKVLKQLIALGAEVNTQDQSKMTPLMWAVYVGNIGGMTILLSQHAKVHLKNEEGETALDLAFNYESKGYWKPHKGEEERQEQQTMVQMLIRAGAKR